MLVTSAAKERRTATESSKASAASKPTHWKTNVHLRVMAGHYGNQQRSLFKFPNWFRSGCPPPRYDLIRVPNSRENLKPSLPKCIPRVVDIKLFAATLARRTRNEMHILEDCHWHIRIPSKNKKGKKKQTHTHKCKKKLIQSLFMRDLRTTYVKSASGKILPVFLRPCVA